MSGALWEVDDPSQRHLLPYADDFVVLPPYRNRGVAARIMKSSLEDAARRGFPFAVSLSAGPVTFVSSLASGWRSAGSYPSVWRQRGSRFRTERLGVLLGGRITARLEATLRLVRRGEPFARLDRAAGRDGTPVSVSRQARPQEMADLVARLPWDGRIRHVRDRRYFSWRFRNPLHDYRFLFWNEGGLQGYLVLQRYLSRWADIERVNIADWEGADDRIRSGLLAAALRWGRFTRVHAWAANGRESTRTILRDQGFEPSVEDAAARRRGLLVSRLGEASPAATWNLGSRSLLKMSDWDLRMLYSMAA